MVSIRVQPLHSMASSQSHDHICQKAFSLSLFCVWTFQSIKKKKKNGRDVTRASHTSRLYPGLYAVIKTMPRMWIQLLCACVLYSYGSRGFSWAIWRHISHMGEMRDSDWSRQILLRSDWLPIIGAIMTTLGHQEFNQPETRLQLQGSNKPKKWNLFFVALPSPNTKKKHPKWDLGKDFSAQSFIER